MNTTKANELKAIAKRTIRIIELLQRGIGSQEIVKLVGVNRQLVDYYKKQLTK